jgi:hypothetical protein
MFVRRVLVLDGTLLVAVNAMIGGGGADSISSKVVAVAIILI